MTTAQINNVFPPVSGPAGINGKTIGISISESENLQDFGFGDVHLQDAAVEFARYLLAGGAKLAYGGDLRIKSFTDILFELVSNHNKSGLKPFQSIESYLAWPLHLNLTTAQKAEYNLTANFHAVPPPDFLNIANPNTYINPDTSDNRYIWSHCLTAMREEINSNVNARLLLGGKMHGYTGKYPGLLEEAYLALNSGKPLYLIGGFGGCARAVIDALKGGTPAAFTDADQMGNDVYKQMVAIYNEKEAEKSLAEQSPINYDGMVAFLHGKGVGALNNGLDADENERLFCTPHIPEMVALVLKGLKRI